MPTFTDEEVTEMVAKLKEARKFILALEEGLRSGRLKIYEVLDDGTERQAFLPWQPH